MNIESGLSGFTRVAINRITTAGETTDVTVQVTSVFGKRVASVETNRLDDDSLRRAVRDAEALARLAPENPEYLPELGEQTYLDVGRLLREHRRADDRVARPGGVAGDHRGRSCRRDCRRIHRHAGRVVGRRDLERPVRLSRRHGRRVNADDPHA